MKDIDSKKEVQEIQEKNESLKQKKVLCYVMIQSGIIVPVYDRDELSIYRER